MIVGNLQRGIESQMQPWTEALSASGDRERCLDWGVTTDLRALTRRKVAKEDLEGRTSVSLSASLSNSSVISKT